MVDEIAPGATLRRVRRLGGGLATDTFAVDLDGSGIRRLVVKRFKLGDDRAPIEWDRLSFAQRVDAPVPEPVAVDADGRWFGAAAIVMTRLPGRADLAPVDVDTWLLELAGTMARVHETSTRGAGSAIRWLPHVEAWEPDTQLRSTPLSDRAVDAIERYLPRATWQSVLTHGDFHPGNILWSWRALSGVVDWNAARLGPRWYEVAYLRADAALLLGGDVADRFARSYSDIVAQPPVDLPLFDLICGLRARQWCGAWLGAYREQGLVATRRQFAARVTPFLQRALAELGV